MGWPSDVKPLRAILLLPFGILLMGAADRPSLVEAAKDGDQAAVRELIKRGGNVNAADVDGTTALHWASYRDDVAAADLLIRAGAKVNAANDLGATPLWAACQNGSTAMVERLLRAGANPNLALLLGETPLMVAARAGNAAVVELLLEKGADPNRKAARGQTALMWAVAQHHPEAVQVLLAHRADVAARSDVWSQVMAVPPHGLAEYNRDIPHGGDTALMFAARGGDLPLAKLLVAAGANVNDQDAWGVSATALAAHAGAEALVPFLLETGADPNAMGAGFSPLHVAIMRRSVPMVRVLLDHGADPNAPLRSWTPTRRASRDFHFPPEHVGATPFWLAARFAPPAIMRLLLDRGADPQFVLRASYQSQDGAERRSQVTTPLMAALGMGGGSAWVQPERATREAFTLEAVQLLADHVDLNLANTDGRTALDAARALKYDKVVEFLESRGARAGTHHSSKD